MADPRNDPDDAYAAFMAMPVAEWLGLLDSLASGGVLTPAEQQAFGRAAVDRVLTANEGVPLDPRPVTDDDIAWWHHRNGGAYRVDMKGEHIGALDIEVVRSFVPGWGLSWNVPYVIPGGDGTTFWFTMFSESFPPVSAVVQPPRAPEVSEGIAAMPGARRVPAEPGVDTSDPDDHGITRSLP